MTTAEARRLILGRQGLIEPFEDPFEAVRAMVAVQTQYAASLETAAAARTRRPKVGWERDALTPPAPLLKSWSLRHTIHVLTPDDLALILDCFGAPYYKKYAKWASKHIPGDFEAVLDDVRQALQDRPLTRAELHERVPVLKGLPGIGWGLDVMGLALRQEVSILGRGADQSFARYQKATVEDASVAALLRRYLEGFGPATLRDFRHWTGSTQAAIRHAFADLRDELVEVEIVGYKETRYALRRCLEPRPGPLGLRLLAKFDPLILAHADKSLFLAENHRLKVFRIAAQVEAVVLDQGVAVGTWRLSRGPRATTFTVEPFRSLREATKRRLEKEASRTAKKLGYAPASVTWEEAPVPRS